MGFAPIDALQIAVAEYANCDYFITCDDEILRIFNKFQHKLKVKIVNPIIFVWKEVLENA